MGRKRKYIQYLLLLMITFTPLLACSGTKEVGESPSVEVCGSIVDAKCVRCHYKTRICNALGEKSVSEWKRTIKFMMKQGAGLTEDEQKKVVTCLSSLQAGSDIICK